MFKKKRNSVIVLLVLGLLLLFGWPLSNPLFSDPYSTILESNEGELLSAKIATDGQWRFPPGSKVPPKFETCIRYFEDEHFYQHFGINPISLLRAARQNWEAGKVVSGGSTLSMQVIRMARKGKARTFLQKGIEMLLALRLELQYSKEEIMQLYAAHAPFGGNVVGLEAAAWRYYQRPPELLSWAETATLAVLPNAPSLIFPGKNQERLLKKRNRLLQKLQEKGVIDETTTSLAKSEELPGKPYALPQEALHLMNRGIAEGEDGKRIPSTLSKSLQQQLNHLVQQQYIRLKQNEIHNLSVLILDNQKNEVLAYVGNTNGLGRNNGHQVDVITASRSTGSLLKPFLYGLAWQDGLILPHSLLADIPTQFAGYAPKNFNKKYDGAVPASKALVRSLNVPAVRLLQEYGVERFYDEFSLFPMPSVNRGSSYYGLAIILGGAEASLWEMCTAYKGISNQLHLLQERSYTYEKEDFYFPKWNKTAAIQEKVKQPTLKGAAIWQLVEALKEGNRPGLEEGWENFANRRKVAWKTGTSFGLRDAWAIGICPEYTIGVWVGNADGEGRPGLTGINVAAPILFQAYDLLDKSSWYQPPYDELYEVVVCKESGFPKGRYCVNFDTLLLSEKSQNATNCPYHQLYQLNKEKNKRVNSSCYAVADMQEKTYLVLPPLMEWFYKRKMPSYQLLPPWDRNCVTEVAQPMELITPEESDQIIIPVELDGSKGRLVVKVAHSNPNATIYWHLDEKYLGESSGNHSKELNPEEGKHVLSLVDNNGNSLVKEIEVID